MNTQAYPLSWPFGWPRAESRRHSEFGEHTVAECVDEIYRQLHILRATDIVISTNLKLRLDGLPASGQRQPADSGTAVYFDLRGRWNGKNYDADHHVLACDKWARVEDNLWAIAKHIDALRGQQRWGVGNVQQAFAGYQALPAPAAGAWWTVLGVDRTAPQDAIRAAYLGKVKVTHPDAGGSAEEFTRVRFAYEQALKERA
jgi:hypothetical protein